MTQNMRPPDCGASNIMFNVPEWPLYILAGIQSIKYLWRFWETRTTPGPTNYLFLGKAFSWAILSSVYVWASLTDVSIIIVRNNVRLANILWIVTDLVFFIVNTIETRRYKIV